MSDDLNQLPNLSGGSVIIPPFSHISHQPQHLPGITKKDDEHLFLHPSCLGDNHRRIQDPYPLPPNNGNNLHQQTPSVGLRSIIDREWYR